MRDGVPLPGVSPTVVVSQLAYRVFGPLQLHRVRIVLDFHGADGRPAGTRADIAARHGVSNGTVFNHARVVREAGARLPLRPETVTAATRPSTRQTITSPGYASPASSDYRHRTHRPRNRTAPRSAPEH